MISGARILLASALMWAAIGAVTQAADWTLDRLADALADARHGPIPFLEERRMNYLDEPLTLSGYVARDGVTIEKHVLNPHKESVVFRGDVVQVRTPEGETHTLDIDDHPILRAMATAFQATLQGRIEALSAQFDADLSGPEDDWRLDLQPKTRALKDNLAKIVLKGRGALVDTIRIETPEGDDSVMTLLYDGG